MDHKTDTDRGRKALDAYLKDCDNHTIVPDVGGAFHFAFMAGRASLAASADSDGVASLSAAEPAVAVPSDGWPAWCPEAVSALVMLDRMDVGPDDDARVDAVTSIVRSMAEKLRPSTAPALTQGAAIAAAYSIDADPLGIRATVADAITGALAFGAQGTNQPPEGHWLAPFWYAAKADKAAPKLTRGAVYAELPEPESYGTRNGRIDPKQPLFTEDDMQDHADRTHALRAPHGQAPAGAHAWGCRANAFGECTCGQATPSPQAAQQAPRDDDGYWGGGPPTKYVATAQAAQQAPAASEWDVRGHLAASLTFWHRLKDKEDDEIVAALQSWGAPAAKGLEGLRQAFAPQTVEQEWTASQSLAYPGKAAQIINAARALLAAPAAPSTPVFGGAKQVNICIDCANADSYGLPDKPCCWPCRGGSNWRPLNSSSMNPHLPASPTIEGESNG